MYDFQPRGYSTVPRRNFLAVIIGIGLILVAILYALTFAAPNLSAQPEQFTVPLNQTNAGQIVSELKSKGFIKSQWVFSLLSSIKGLHGTIAPGGYAISKAMNAWEVAGVFSQPPSSVWVVIPEGLRKEEIADLFGQKLNWSSAQDMEWITKDTTTDSSYSEGVYFPDTYLVPKDETPFQVAKRLQAHFEEKFAPYATEASKQNIKWTTALTLASIIQREAAGKDDMALISGILWNRLLHKMKLQVDSTVQYVRGKTPTGWWAPISPADEKIDSPYNTYLYTGLPPHPISNPGIDAINAALNPASTTCMYYIHDASRVIHCASTYKEQEANIKKYLQ